MRYVVRIANAMLLVLILPGAVAGQALPEPPAIGSAFDTDALRDLPLGGNIYALLETTQADVIADRFNSGGLNVSGPSRLNGFLSSWTQTLFRIGDLNVSDPGGGGALLFPEALPWQRLQVDTGLMPADINNPGLAVTFDPRRPGARWTGTMSGSGSGGSLAAGAPRTNRRRLRASMSTRRDRACSAGRSAAGWVWLLEARLLALEP